MNEFVSWCRHLLVSFLFQQTSKLARSRNRFYTHTYWPAKPAGSSAHAQARSCDRDHHLKLFTLDR